ncbi:MAG TPA: hypothetical protein VHZ76_01930 [Gammaproteobacteria bacterium]|jgi:hypothetical protein|nr:hypothetical protein [Gammaproteobacteria bacterium]
MNHFFTLTRFLSPQHKWFYFVIAILSLCISINASLRNAVVNPDGICYLSAAEVFGQSGLKAAMQLCGQAKWPFYSMLIYGFAQVTSLSYASAAYVLNAVFALCSIWLFISIVVELAKKNPTINLQRIAWLAALTLLCWHEFNNVREYIVRDHGFWAFYLLSLWCLLRYFSNAHWLSAVGWSGSLLVATLFRIEGAIFLVLLPCILLLKSADRSISRWKSFFLLNAPFIFAAGLLSAWLLLHPQRTWEELGRLPELFQHVQHAITNIATRYQTATTILAQQVLSQFSAHQAGLLWLMMLPIWYLFNVIQNLSWIYAGLIIYACWQRSRALVGNDRWILVSYLFINVLITLVFFLENLFLSKRYLVALSLILLLQVPFALHTLINQWSQLRYRLALFFVAGAILFSALAGWLQWGYSKAYIADAGQWLATQVPAHANLYANDYQLMYYSQHFGGATLFKKVREYSDVRALSDEKWRHYDYLAVRINKKEANVWTAVLQDIPLVPVQVFSNERGDKVVIYKR